MDHEAAAKVRERLGADYAALERLPDIQRQRLLMLLHEARVHQEKQLYRALNHALDFLPSVLRGPVRRLFRGR